MINVEKLISDVLFKAIKPIVETYLTEQGYKTESSRFEEEYHGNYEFLFIAIKDDKEFNITAGIYPYEDLESIGLWNQELGDFMICVV